MVVDPDRAARRLVHDGGAYFFCSLNFSFFRKRNVNVALRA
jgi:YHS domain-containing protein